MIGPIGEFDPAQEQWTQYTERLSHFLTANGITEEERKKAVLLTVMGRRAYKLLRNLIAPKTVDETTYSSILEAMKLHYCPQPSEIVKRFEFNSRFRQPGKTVSTYVAELRALAEFCNFGDSLDNMLRDRLVCGINNEQVQKRLLSETDLTFKKALDLAQGLEAAAKNAHTLKSAAAGATSTVPPVEVHKVAPQRDGQSGRQQHTPCHRCGKKNHAPATCRFRNAKCHNCGRTGHLKAVCYAPPREVGSATRRPRRSRNVQLVQEAASMEESDEYSLYKVHGAGCVPFRVNIEVEGQQLPMEIDKGASLSLISEATWKRLWPNKRLLPSTVQLRTYTGEPLSVRGFNACPGKAWEA